MTRSVLVLLVSLAAACGGPPPEGFALPNSEPAVRALLTHFGANPDSQPTIWGVDPDPTCTTATGGLRFRDPGTDQCAGGLSIGGDVYLLVVPGLLWSQSSLSHELVHWIGGDDHHKRRDFWSPGGKADQGKAHLLTLPALNTVAFPAN